MNSPITESSSPSRFPSFEEYWKRQEYVYLTDSGFRIKWSLSGPLTSTPSPISVMPQGYITNDPVEPYYQPLTSAISASTGGDPAINTESAELTPAPLWHPISRDPFTDPPVSSITIRIGPLNYWEQNCVYLHDDHSYQPPGEKSDDEDDDEDENVEPQEASNPCYDGHDPDDPDDDWPECNGRGSGHLIECCGGKRPRRTIFKYTVRVKAISNGGNGGGGGGGFVNYT